MAFQFSNNSIGVLDSAIDQTQTLIQVSGLDGNPFLTSIDAQNPQVLVILSGTDLEVVYMTANVEINATTRGLTVTRAQESTTGISFSAGTEVIGAMTAEMLTDLFTATANNSAAISALSGAVVQSKVIELSSSTTSTVWDMSADGPAYIKAVDEANVSLFLDSVSVLNGGTIHTKLTLAVGETVALGPINISLYIGNPGTEMAKKTLIYTDAFVPANSSVNETISPHNDTAPKILSLQNEVLTFDIFVTEIEAKPTLGFGMCVITKTGQQSTTVVS